LIIVKEIWFVENVSSNLEFFISLHLKCISLTLKLLEKKS
jgi:hypothetical protein